MKNVSIKVNETEKEQAFARYIESIVNSDVSEEQKVAMLKHAEELKNICKMFKIFLDYF